ncbi:kynureninase-like [Dysidea avara]|uniref:kynureninase-like n=1 Tax=Dysidea avara TaxID=196820 RepID=UPI00331E7272
MVTQGSNCQLSMSNVTDEGPGGTSGAHTFTYETHMLSSLRLSYMDMIQLETVKPREGEETLRTEDIVAKIMEEGIQFITGQAFDMKTITEAATLRMVGWWAHKRETRFNLDNCLDLRPGAGGFAVTTLPALETVTLIAALKKMCICVAGVKISLIKSSIQIMESCRRSSMKTFRKKSRLLTGYCELLLKNLSPEQQQQGDQEPQAKRKKTDATVHIVTPSDPEQRGCCLAVRFSCSGDEIWKMLERGIALQCFRRIVRITPSPLYNMFSEVLHFYTTLVVEVLNDIE